MILHKDREKIVVEKDDDLVGKRIAMNGAYQINLALKKKIQGGADGGHHGHVH